MAVGSVVAVLLVAIVAVGAVVTASTRDLPEGPAAAPALPPTATVSYDLDTRRARVGEVSVTMPAAPYECQSGQALTPTFSDAAVCNALVFADYQGTEDWFAGLGFGLVSQDLQAGDDVKATTRNVFDSLQKQFYADEATTAKNFLYQELTDVPTTQAVALAGELHYDIEGLESTYDKVLIIVVKLDAGGYVAWFSARPDGAPQATVDVLNDVAQQLRHPTLTLGPPFVVVLRRRPPPVSLSPCPESPLPSTATSAPPGPSPTRRC